MLAAALLPFLLNSAPPERPRDIWVFRSVLDNHPRMVTAALSKDLWVAYDATNCTLYKAWTGGVKFDGAVYTSVHGPQPTSVGKPYYLSQPDRKTWSVVSRTGQFDRTVFRGYRFQNGQVTLNYEIPIGEGRKPVIIRETPEVGNAIATHVGFDRTIRVENLPSDSRVLLKLMPTEGASEFTTDGTYETRGERGSGVIALRRQGSTRVTLVAPKSGTPAGVTIEDQPQPTPQRESAEREPGVAMRIYDIGKAMSQLPRLVRSQSPNVNKVVPLINFSTTEDFSGLEKQFLVHLSGYLNVTKRGTYNFRLTSDDGSKFTIRDTVVVNNDGLHGAQPADGEFDMDPGEHPFFLEYFENDADNVLKLEWKTPGSSEFVLVPPEAFTTPKGEVRVTAPGKKLVLTSAVGRPGDRQPLDGVHPSYDLIPIRPATFRPRVGGIDFLPDGRMVICNWEPDGGVYALNNVLGQKPGTVGVKRIAAGLAEPLGIKVVNGEVYVLQKQELTRLIDHDKDGVADEYYAVANGWGVTANFHEFAFGLVYDKGYFYATLATAINPGGASTQPQNQDRGKVVKIAPDGRYEFVAHGLRTPNGIGIGYKGGIYVADNQGDWLPSSKIVHVKEGAFYGSRSVNPTGTAKTPETLPVVWLPQGEIGNSPSQPTFMKDGPYRGQMLHGDVTHGGVKRVFVEEVGGQQQGVVFRFTQGLEGGVNRICWGPDGALYVGGIGSTGNWGQEGKERFGLEKILYNGKSTFEMLAVRAKKNGVEIEFTEPLAPGQGHTPAYYSVTRWKYVPTEMYGGPKINERVLPISSVTLSRDRRKVFLAFDGMLPNHVAYVRCHPSVTSASQAILWSTEAWYTCNIVPTAVGRVAPAAEPGQIKTTSEERSLGFIPIFDGTDLKNFKGWKRDNVGPGWAVAADGSLGFTPGVGGGDIVTKQAYGNFELRFSWKVSKGANSGVFYRSDETLDAPWSSGPEYQILDNDEHRDGAEPKTTAASNYALIAPRYDVTRPVGEWNDAVIVCRGEEVEHWLNGVRVLAYRFDSAEFAKILAESKFADSPTFGKRKAGKIVFQDHGDRIWYRNIRVRPL